VPTVPKVVLGETHALTCKLKAGDEFPELKLTAPDGQTTLWESAQGEKLTVVFFWTSQGENADYALLALPELTRHVAEKYKDRGVRVLGINVGESPETVQATLKENPAGFPQFVDPDQKAFQQVATSLLPRIYLLDADRLILWFDIQYGTQTRQDLIQSLEATLPPAPTGT